jgi:RNA polymerase sigma-70 factor (ECF subfamily)
MNEHDWITDKALVEAAQRGDRDAAACLYHRHIDRVHRICRRIVLDPSLAQDCVQEVWLKVFRSLGRFRGRSSFGAWLNSVAAHTAIDHYRRSKRRGRQVDMDDPAVESLAAEEPAEEEQLDGRLARQRIHEALEQISVSQRTAFVLRYYEDMPLPEIARILGCRQGTVRTHIRRCLLALRARLTAKLNQ